MKNKLFKIFIVVLCIFTFLSVTSFVFLNNAKADSGWDSDYDSGGSDWGGGSDWDSDSDYDYDYDSSSNNSYNSVGSDLDSSSSDTNIIFIIIFICTGFLSYIPIFIIIIPIIFLFRSIREKKSNISIPLKLSDEHIHQVDPKLNIEEFKTKAYMIYLDIQYAWMNFNYDRLRELTTDELYNMYSMQLDTLSVEQIWI